MTWKNALIKSLEEWDTKNDDKNMSMRDVSFIIGFPIGLSNSREEWTLSFLEKRIDYLVEKEKMSEKFVVEGLLNEMTSMLDRTISQLGEVIINNEYLQRSAVQAEIEFDFIEEKLTEMKDKNYIFRAEKLVDSWREIVAKNFSLKKRREYEFNEMNKNHQKFKKFAEALPEEDLDKPMNELFDKLKK